MDSTLMLTGSNIRINVLNILLRRQVGQSGDDTACARGRVGASVFGKIGKLRVICTGFRHYGRWSPKYLLDTLPKWDFSLILVSKYSHCSPTKSLGFLFFSLYQGLT